MSSWMFDPKPCSETVTVSERRINGEHYDSINGWRLHTVSEIDRFLTVKADDTATGITTLGIYGKFGSEEWVMAILTAYDRIQELRERDPDKTGVVVQL